MKSTNSAAPSIKITDAVEHSIEYALYNSQRGVIHTVPYIVSSPGIGKTEITRSFAKKHNFEFIGIEPALERSEKFSGIPDVIEVEYGGEKHLGTVWTIPEMFLRTNELSEKAKREGKSGVICLLDDFHLCDQDQLQQFFELFSHRSYSGHKIAGNVSYIAAGNDSSAAGARTTLSAIINRMTKIHAVADRESWLKYARDNFIHSIVVNFLSSFDNEQHFSTPESATDQFASPRTWTQGVSYLLDMYESMNKLDAPEKQSLIRSHVLGSIGLSAGSAFMDYFTYYRSINFNRIFKQGKLDIPTSPMERYATIGAITDEFYKRRVLEEDSKKGAAISKVFGNMVKTVSASYRELVPKILIQLVEKKSKDKKYPSGYQLLSQLCSKGELTSEITDAFAKHTSAMSKR